MPGRLYLLSMRTNALPAAEYRDITTVNTGKYAAGEAIILHRFKVIGEDSLLLVVEETTPESVDDLSQRLLARKLSVNFCTPLIHYEQFAKSIHVTVPDEKGPPAENGEYFWLDVIVQHPGKSTAELMTLWKEEAESAIKMRLTSQMALFKVVGERKVHVFMKSTAAAIEDISVSLPMMVKMGEDLTIKTKSVNRF